MELALVALCHVGILGHAVTIEKIEKRLHTLMEKSWSGRENANSASTINAKIIPYYQIP
jgi:hypothetical protein